LPRRAPDDRTASTPIAAGPLGGPNRWITEVGDILLLTGKTFAQATRPPFAWRTEFIEQCWLILRRCLLPLMFAVLVFSFGTPGIQGGNVISVLGSPDRLGAFFVMASVRELAPWVDGMVVAGVAGTAICADLGARRVRDELDALAVMGVDIVEAVIVPRFLALGVMTALLNFVSVLFGIIGGWLAEVLVFGGNSAGYVATFTSNFTLPDLFGSIVKTSIFGFIIGIVACYKGMKATGGAEGVGRAVNQAVVLSFVGIWAFNYLFTTTLLAAFPDTAQLH
jgi:phospholipid/cholesterol/gamma-HCH transport system permease protein